jgi:hypothetical protein
MIDFTPQLQDRARSDFKGKVDSRHISKYFKASTDPAHKQACCK